MVNSKKEERKRKYNQSYGHVETLEEKSCIKRRKNVCCNHEYPMPNLIGGHWNEPASQAEIKIGPVGFPIWFSNSHCYTIICQACRVVFYQMWETQYQIQAEAREEGMLPHRNNLLRKDVKSETGLKPPRSPSAVKCVLIISLQVRHFHHQKRDVQRTWLTA